MTFEYFDTALKEKLWLKKLVEEYDQIIRKYGIKGLKPANLRLSAGTTTLGSWSKNLRIISLSKKLLIHAPWESVIQIFKHEMAHQIADEILGGDDGHGPIFIKACKMVWVEPWARSARVEIGYPESNGTSRDRNHEIDEIEREFTYNNSADYDKEIQLSSNHLAGKLRSEETDSQKKVLNSFESAYPLNPGETVVLKRLTDDSSKDMASNETRFWENFNRHTTDQEGRKLRERLTKLLALSESSNAHEASLALAKAREMQQGLLLTSLDGYEDFETRIMRPQKRRLERHYSQIAAILSLHYNVRIIFSREFDAKELVDFQTMEILGQRHTVELAEYVYHFLLKTLRSSYNLESKKRLVDRKSFYSGFLDGLSEKLKASASAPPQPPEGKTLILKQNQLLDQYLNRRHPLVTTRRLQGRSVDGGSFECGREKGRNLDIRSPIKASEMGLLR